MNIGRYLRGEDRHVGTARIQQSPHDAGSHNQQMTPAVQSVIVAAELRRIHAQRDALLAALKTIKENAGNPESVYRISSAAIKQAEENT